MIIQGDSSVPTLRNILDRIKRSDTTASGALSTATLPELEALAEELLKEVVLKNHVKNPI